MNTLTEAPPPPGRLRAAWTAAHATVPGVPRWARIAALAIPFTVLPSGLWRVAAMTFHAPIVIHNHDMGPGDLPSWLPGELYVVLLSVISEIAAFAAVGLVAPWGEVFPRWVPGLRGRTVPPAAAVVPAALAAAVLTCLWTWAAVTMFMGTDIRGRPLIAGFPLNTSTWQGWLAIAAYAPLVLWGPLLAAVTAAYAWRRSHLPVAAA
ncbi:hypothetical protein [Sphaerisporangium fuscum]|uniref:hypothetical protein n=1 Tax=Sphaerisporangium fuscum TaxID=2835868 RepID=UPI001BDD7727|nr:hypothetical protein [Sphaerisporangium fuscum]